MANEKKEKKQPKGDKQEDVKGKKPAKKSEEKIPVIYMFPAYRQLGFGSF